MIDEGINEEILYLGLTRPALWRGLPYRYVIFLAMIASLVIINIGVLYGIGIGIIGWFFGLWIFKNDYHLLNIIFLKYQYSSPNRNYKFWKANSYDPT